MMQQIIGNEEILRRLAQDNPWWESPDWKTDKTEHQRLYFTQFCDLAFNLGVNRSIILMGPRRVGKTVMLEQLIHHALGDTSPDKPFDARRIFFVSIDTPLYSNIPLDGLVTLFEEATGGNPDDRRLIIFDEIQYLKNWEQHLKVLTTKFPKTRFIASGSAAAALKLKSDESGAGRFSDFYLPPLTFAEFLEFTGQEFNGDVAALNKAFIEYINYGSYPEAVLNPAIQKNPQQFIGRYIIDKVLLWDLPSLYRIRDPQELNRLFIMLAYNTGQEVNLESLSKNSGVSKPTLKRYLEYLEAAMLIKRVRRIDDTGRTFQRDRQFKVYLTSPSMWAALFVPITGDSEDQLGHLVETALFAQVPHEHHYYARWKSGSTTHEVDMVAMDIARNTPLSAYEIKWSDRHVTNPSRLVGLVEFAKKHPDATMYATTKKVFDTVNHQGIKIHLMPCAVKCLVDGRLSAKGESNLNPDYRQYFTDLASL